MTEQSLAPLARKVGFTVFKLGAVGSFLGVILGVVTGAMTHGWGPMHVWLAYALAVAVAGAILGVIGRLFGSAETEPLDPRIAARLPIAAAGPQGMARQSLHRPAVSAFRPMPKHVVNARR